MIDEPKVSERLLKNQREEYIKTHGWLWGWRKPVEEPKVMPRKLFADDSYMFMRPRIRVER